VKRAKGAIQKVAKPTPKSSPPSPGPRKADSFPIVGIGASAGGLEAFKELLTSLPEKTGMAYVLVPHLDPDHQSVLREILSRFTKIPIAEAMDGMPVERDRIYVIPPRKTMGIASREFVLVEREPTQNPYLPIDYFFGCIGERPGRSGHWNHLVGDRLGRHARMHCHQGCRRNHVCPGSKIGEIP